ncbi:MAG: Uma2 family endonuclease [Pseudonocardiaceae bacterium]
MSAQPLDELFAGHAGPWSERDWLELPESMGRVELLDGTLLVSPSPAAPHQRLVLNLAQALREVVPDEFEVFPGLNIRMRPGRILIPDIVVLTPAGLDGTIFGPDSVALAVEVTSPSNAWADRLVKPDAYARAGIPHYLRIDLDRGPDHLGASCYSLGPAGVYSETGRADEAGRLVFDRPFPADLDLATLARATRYPRQH